jgi:hypothetical protein
MFMATSCIFTLCCLCLQLCCLCISIAEVWLCYSSDMYYVVQCFQRSVVRGGGAEEVTRRGASCLLRARSMHLDRSVLGR